MDLVSVIITTYKRKDELEKAIVSVLCQTYKDIEIIIVDDNTIQKYSDFIRRIVDKYNNKGNIAYIKNKKNLGGALSRNVGIEHSQGKYISFLDDDDAYYPTKIEKQVECFENSQLEHLGIVYCYTVALDENEEVLHTYTNTIRGEFLYESMVNTIAATTQWLCLKEALIKVNGFRDVPSKQDTTLLMDLALAGYEIDYVPEVLSKYYELPIERISGVGHKNLEGEILLRKHMREHYMKLEQFQIKKIEYNVTLRIYYLLIKLKMYKAANKNLKLLIKNNVNTKLTLKIILKHFLYILMKK